MEEAYPYFPLFVDLSEKKLLVVGTGAIARRRILTLEQFVPRLRVIAPETDPALDPLEAAGKLEILRRPYAPGDAAGADLVLAATGDPAVNAAVGEECRRLGIPVNLSSDRHGSDFYFPGIARQGHLVVGVTASGRDHAAARRVTEQARGMLAEGEQKV